MAGFFYFQYLQNRIMEATYHYITNNIEDNILTITINREDKMNALNITLLKEIKNVVNNAQSNLNIHGIIITGHT